MYILCFHVSYLKFLLISYKELFLIFINAILKLFILNKKKDLSIKPLKSIIMSHFNGNRPLSNNRPLRVYTSNKVVFDRAFSTFSIESQIQGLEYSIFIDNYKNLV